MKPDGLKLTQMAANTSTWLKSSQMIKSGHILADQAISGARTE